MGQYSKYLSFDHIKKKANQASKCPQSAKKRTLLFKKKWLRKQSLKRLRPLRRLQQRQRKKRPKNNVFKNTQKLKTSKPRCKNLLYNKTSKKQQNNIKAEFILKKKETIFNTL